MKYLFSSLYLNISFSTLLTSFSFSINDKLAGLCIFNLNVEGSLSGKNEVPLPNKPNKVHDKINPDNVTPDQHYATLRNDPPYVQITDKGTCLHGVLPTRRQV